MSKKICILVSSEIISGAEIVLKDYLEKTQQNILLILSEKIYNTKFFHIEKKNIEIVKIKYLKDIKKDFFGKIKTIFFHILSGIEIVEKLRREDIEIILGNNTKDIYYSPFVKFFNRKIKYYNIIHDMLEIIPIFYKITYKFVDSFITVSEACKTKIIETGVPQEKIKVIYNGLLPLKKLPFKLFKDKKIIGFVGNLDERKNVLEFLDFLIIAKRNKLNIEGYIVFKNFDIDYYQKVKDKNQKYSLNITFRENIPREKLNEIYLSFDYLYICSKSDPLPTVVLESLNNGIPVIGKNVDGIPEMVKNNFNGYLYNEISEINEILKKINNIKNEEYQKLRENAQKTINNKFDLRTKIEIMDFYLKRGNSEVF